MIIKKALGWLPDGLDFRDYKFSEVMQVPLTLPMKVDIREKLTPIRDQGNLGSCTGFGIAAALEALDPPPKAIMSPLFIYYRARAILGTVNEDSGGVIRDCIKSCAEKGTCYEACWPYNISKFKVTPPGDCYWQAEKHQILSYYRINTLREMKVCLAAGFGFVFGFAVYGSMYSTRTIETGIIPMPKTYENYEGGHCVFGCGYDDNTERIMIRNSWGSDIGDNGYFYLPYDYVKDRNLSDDFWTIRKIEL
jgi:C1A family cysteine protease